MGNRGETRDTARVCKLSTQQGSRVMAKVINSRSVLRKELQKVELQRERYSSDIFLRTTSSSYIEQQHHIAFCAFKQARSSYKVIIFITAGFHSAIRCKCLSGGGGTTSVFSFFLFFCGLPAFVRRTCRITYDGRSLRCLLFSLHYNVVPLCRGFVATDLVSLY